MVYRVEREKSLAFVNPLLAKEWHSTKNGDITPFLVTANSGKIVWWMCENGHEWQAPVFRRNKRKGRTKGTGCPTCARAKNHLPNVSIENSLAVRNPKLEKQWNYQKNGALTPSNVTVRSHKKVWWICEKGHEWQSRIDNRNKGNGYVCPICSNENKNVFSLTHPHLISYWDIEKNGSVINVTINSRKKVWWKCEHGHEWENNPSVYRYRDPNLICPYCNPLKDVNLTVTHPLLAEEWDYKKNGMLAPSDVKCGSQRMVWWKCEKGHAFQKRIDNRTLYGQGCPDCRKENKDSLAITHPELAHYWHYKKNTSLTPSDVTYGSGEKVWWICENGHEWQSRIIDMIARKEVRCFHCQGEIENALSLTYPLLAEEWDYKKNGMLAPSDVKCGSNRVVWWKCKKGHEWQGRVHDRTEYQTACPYCQGRKVSEDNNLATVHPLLAEEWHPTKNGELTPLMVTKGSNKRVWWRCNQGHEWQATIKYRYRRGTTCPICSELSKKNKKRVES